MRGWRPSAPEKILKVERDGDVVWVGIIDKVRPDGDRARVNAVEAVQLLAEMPLPFPPPGITQASDSSGFGFWWRQMLYVFDLPDPRLFPPLPSALAEEEKRIADRFVFVTRALAASGLVSWMGGMNVVPGDGTREESVTANFPPLDVQAGFASLLRQCNAAGEATQYDRVKNIIWQASRQAGDAHSADRVAALRIWREAVIRLRRKSLNQLVMDQFVEHEGWKAFENTERHSPQEVLKTFNYGDLIHWGSERDDVLSPDEDAFRAADQRFAFLGAALGLAHVFIGFGELVRAAITPRTHLLIF